MAGENFLATSFLRELEVEAPACRKCLERIPERLFNWKPHERSMTLGYLSLIVAEIPMWIRYAIEIGEIDLAKIKHFQPKNTAELVNHFEENLKGAKNALQGTTDESLSKPFYLKNNGQILISTLRKENIRMSINHLVHHRGQLTVYMRLNNIPIPSIYGPSADERGF